MLHTTTVWPTVVSGPIWTKNWFFFFCLYTVYKDLWRPPRWFKDPVHPLCMHRAHQRIFFWPVMGIKYAYFKLTNRMLPLKNVLNEMNQYTKKYRIWTKLAKIRNVKPLLMLMNKQGIISSFVLLKSLHN